MSVPGVRGAGGAGAAMAGQRSIAVEVEAFGEMTRHELLGYVAGLAPSAVAANSAHWTSAQRGVAGVIDRLEEAVAGVAESDFGGAFPDAVRQGHRAFLAAARGLGEALGAPAERLGSAAPQLEGLQSRVEAAGGWGAVLAFPAMEQLAPESAELAALMESLYVPTIQQASAVPLLPAPSEPGTGDAGPAAATSVTAADGAADAGRSAGHAFAPGAAPTSGDAGGERAAGDGASPSAGPADEDAPLAGISDAGAGAGDGTGGAVNDRDIGQGAIAPGGGRGAPGAGAVGAEADGAGVEAASFGVSDEPGGALGPSTGPGGTEAPSWRSGSGHSAQAPGSLAARGPGTAAIGVPLSGPGSGGVPEGGAGASIPGRGAGRLAAAPGSTASSAGTGAGQSASQSAVGPGRRMPGAGMLGGAGRGGRQGQGYEAAEFLTTVDNGDDLIGDLGRVVQPVLGDGTRS